MNNSSDKFLTYAIDNYSNMIIRIAYNYTRNKHDAEDILQDVFLQLLKAPPFESQAHFKAWLIRVTINKAKNLLKASSKKRTLPLEAAQNKFVPTTERFLDLIENLNKKERILLYLFYFEGYTAKEIADMLKIKERAVLMRLSRARAKLKTILKEDF